MLIITPNRRLAAFSLLQHQAQLQELHKAWETPDMYGLEAWLSQLWQLCLELNPTCYRPVLSKVQQQRLFENILQNSKQGVELLRVNAAAQNVLQAWTFLQQWQVKLEQLAPYAEFAPDTAAFLVWVQAYLQWLNANDYYDFHSMVDVLIANLQHLRHVLPREICLRGFNELTPQYSRFFEALELCGVDISADQLLDSASKATRQRSAFVDSNAEFAAAAQWAALHLQTNPQQIIGVVVPELETYRGVVAAIFEKHISSAQLNISAPLPLTNYALIDSALLVLELAKPLINFSDFSIILRCPFIAHNVTLANQRSLLDRMLRHTLEAKTSWKQVFAAVATVDVELSSCIAKFIETIATLSGQHNADHWVHIMQQLLDCWRWPNIFSGERALTVNEADLLSCWHDLLHEYCKLGMLLPEHSFSYALQVLQRLAAETPFLPAETGATKVHVLGMLEADGIAFDRLWVCGMTRDNWPMDASPNPFIPMELQRQYDLPRSSPQRELTVAQRLTANLQLGGKQEVIFSFALTADDQPLAPSNLITHLPIVEVALPKNNTVRHNVKLETWQDANAAPLDLAYLSGGTKILELQAQCPFKANADLRLHAAPLPEPQLYLNAAERGKLVHEVLEQFWLQCKSHAELLEWLPHTVTTKLSVIITDVLQRWKNIRPHTLTKTYIALESQRLLDLLQRWLHYEAQREPFVVAELEHKKLINVGLLQFNIQIDRIDQLDSNNYAVIDYKTGQVHPREWFSDPIYYPQLPLYAVYAAANVVAVAVASLLPNSLQFRGVSAQENILPNVKSDPDWEPLKAQWRNSLEMAAADFVAGQATVRPFSDRVCNICKLQAFCRIYD